MIQREISKNLAFLEWLESWGCRKRNLKSRKTGILQRQIKCRLPRLISWWEKIRAAPETGKQSSTTFVNKLLIAEGRTAWKCRSHWSCRQRKVCTHSGLCSIHSPESLWKGEETPEVFFFFWHRHWGKEETVLGTDFWDSVTTRNGLNLQETTPALPSAPRPTSRVFLRPRLNSREGRQQNILWVWQPRQPGLLCFMCCLLILK